MEIDCKTTFKMLVLFMETSKHLENHAPSLQQGGKI